jgi:ABC-type uncharacterized transport system fused permease/ATPase subunit
MTAGEALLFYASIILPPETTKHTKKARIARVLAMMGLTHHAHTLVRVLVCAALGVEGVRRAALHVHACCVPCCAALRCATPTHPQRANTRTHATRTRAPPHARRDTQVGGMLPGGILLRGLSGGEKKRLAIACGVVAGPSMVFLDEPTSGLDSFAALNVVLFLKSMATQGGGTLIASLHQPRSAIWGQLDQVRLSSGGGWVWVGALGLW